MPEDAGRSSSGPSSGKKVILLSEHLQKHGGLIKEEHLKAYRDAALAAIQKPDRSNEDTNFFADYMKYHVQAKIADKAIEDQVTLRGQDSGNQVQLPSKPPTIKLNELVKKPETFDGLSPPPQRWLDDYETACRANGWSDALMVRYLPTFLTKTAHDWYVTRAQPLLNEFTTWSEARLLFLRAYIGESERAAAKRELYNTLQEENESISSFMPRLLRILMVAEPRMGEFDKVETIKDKLAPIYQDKMCLVNPVTLDELNDACLSIEAGHKAMRAAKEKYARFRQGNSNHNKQPKQPIITQQPGPSEKQERKKREIDTSLNCTRCERQGHIAEKCYSYKKADGTRLPRPAKKIVNAVEIVEPTKEDSEDEPVVTTIHRVAAVFSNQKLPIMMTKGQPDNLIVKNILLNGKEFKAMADCGSSVSLINADVVSKEKWPTVNRGPALVAANGDKLTSRGSVKLEMELTIGNTTKKISNYWVVVEGLCVPVLLGNDVMGWLDIQVNVRNKTLQFNKQPKNHSSGVRSIKDTVIPARSEAVVKAAVNAVGTIYVLPLQFPSGLLVANCVTPIVEKKCDLLVANLENTPLLVPKNTQMGCYEHIQEKEDNATIQANAVIQVGESDEVVQIGDDLSKEQVVELSQLIAMNCKAFSINGEIGVTDVVTHDIELLPGAKPITEPLRRRAYAQKEECNKQIKNMIAQGIVESSTSPWANAYVMVKKKTGQMRLCIDFRRLNDMTKKCSYPLPNVDECIETLAGKTYFSQLDLASGFWQIPMSESAKEATAFRTEEGHFQFTRMPFGLCNAPASFQRMINAIFSGLKGIHLQVFIDDICLATCTWSEHLKLLQQVFEILIKANLKLKSSKCVFGARQVVFLGHEISRDGIRQEQRKLEAMLALPFPTNVQELKRTLGMFSYYRKFVPGFAIKAEPLTRLTRKKQAFFWGEEQKEAMKAIMASLAANATLCHFDHYKPVALKTDASGKGIAGILLQQTDDEWKLLSCCSRRLSPAEQNYGATDLEGLAVVYSITKFRHFLLGRKFQVLTDHCALCALRTKMPNSSRLKRWAIILSEYDFEIVYTRGQLHEDVDCLSRAPVADENDELIEARIFAIRPISIIKCTMVRPLNASSWIDTIENDAECQPLIIKANQGKEQHYRTIDGILYYRDKLFIPAEKRKELISENHDSLTADHGGIQATLNRLEEYYWPGMSKDVEEFVKSCDICQKRKSPRSLPAGGMYPIEAFEPLELVAIDCLGPLAASIAGKCHIIVAVDVFTRFLDAKAVRDIQGSTFAKYLMEYVSRYGVPRKILTDNATTFVNQEVKELAFKLSCEHLKSIPHHSRSNAVAERVIQNLQEKMSMVLANATTAVDWEKALPAAILALNSSYHKSTGYSPFRLMYGKRKPVQSNLAESSRQAHDMYANLLEYELDEARTNAIANNADHQLASRPYFEEKHLIREFKVGDMVLSRVMGRRAKLKNRFEGPYEVITKERDVYKIKNTNNSTTLMRHVKDLKKYHAREESNGNVNMIKAALLVMVLGCISSTSAMIIFDKVPPILWTDTKHYVASGLINYHFRINFRQECGVLGGFGALPQEIETAVLLCRRIYENQILQKITHYNPKKNTGSQSISPSSIHRSKRSIIEYITATFICNTISTLIDRIWPNAAVVELEERQKVLESAENILATRLNATTLLVAAVKDAVVANAEALAHNSESIDRILFNHPELMVATSYITTKMQLMGMNIDRLRTSFRARHPDLSALSGLTDTEILDDLEPESIIKSSIKLSAPSVNTIDVEFVARKRVSNTEVYKISAFRIWANLTETPTLMEYIGPRFLIHNKTSNCIKSIQEPQNDYVNAWCTETNYADKALANWQYTITATNPYLQPAKSQVIEAWPNAIVYCFPLNITVEEETDECPPYAFQLNNKLHWSTSDGYQYNPSSIEIMASEKLDPVLTQVHTIHFKNASEIMNENKAIRKIVALNQKIQDLTHEALLIGKPGSIGLSYMAAVHLLLALISIGMLIIIIWIPYNYIKTAERNRKVAGTVIDAIQGEGTYATIRRKRKGVSKTNSFNLGSVRINELGNHLDQSTEEHLPRNLTSTFFNRQKVNV